MVLGGIDKTGPHIFGTHPIGNYIRYKATAVGAGTEIVLSILKEEYHEDLTLEQSIKLAVKCLVKALKARELPLRIKIAVIPVITKKLDMLSDETVEVYIKEVA